MDEKRIHTEGTVMNESNSGLVLPLYKIGDPRRRVLCG